MADLDGDRWIRCDLGHRHWGRFGAAGLLPHARDEAGQTRVLLQYRSLWSSHGGTWGLFGGARRRDEPSVAAALREAAEEATLPVDMLRITGVMRDDHGGWAYDTVIGEMPRPVPVSPVSAETEAAAWVVAENVGGRTDGGETGPERPRACGTRFPCLPAAACTHCPPG